MTEPGIYQISNNDYHHNPKYAALSKSGLVDLNKSPSVYIAQRESDEETNNSALNIGSAFHTIVLEPDLFDKETAVFDGIRRGKNWDAFKEQNNGKTIIKPNEYENIAAMKKAISKHKTATMLIEGADKEQSVFWVDPIYGFLCKCRPDVGRPDLCLLADLKSAVSATPDEFLRACIRYKYHWQAAWYLNGINAVQDDVFYREFLFIVTEKEPPYLTGVYRMPQEMIDHARTEIAPLIKTYADCLEKDEWPGLPDEVIELEVPTWM